MWKYYISNIFVLLIVFVCVIVCCLYQLIRPGPLFRLLLLNDKVDVH